jgi:UDP-glucose 4-epimerase
MNEVMHNINTKRCLVLGGNGFIGSHLVDALLRHGYLVRSFDRANAIPAIVKTIPRAGLESVEGDFASEADIAGVVDGCDVCFHLISTTLPKSSNSDPIFDIETNLIATVRLLNHAVKGKISKIVFASSGGTVYGPTLRTPIYESHPTNPISSYGIIKLSIEKYLGLFHQLYGLEYSALRLSNPYGERQRPHASQGAVAVFMGKALRGETIEIWWDGSVVRDYLYISDVVDALVKTIEYQGDERIFNIGSGRGLSINEILDGIGQVLGRYINRNYTNPRAFDVPINVLSIDRAKRYLDWQPKVNLLEGLERTAAWLMSNSGGQDI